MDIDPHLAKAAPGIVGSAISMWRLRGLSMWQRCASFVGGLGASQWGTDALVRAWPVMSQEATAFVLGLFGMSLISKAFETIDQVQPGDVLQRFFGRRDAPKAAQQADKTPAHAPDTKEP